MFVSSGAGALALLFFGGFQLLAWLIFRLLPLDHYTFGVPIACVLSALCTWILGRKLNGKGTAPRHTVFQVRMEYWGIILGVITLWLWRSYL